MPVNETDIARERVLQAFLRAPGRRLDSVAIKQIPGTTNARARMSELRQMGHRWHKTHIKGTLLYMHVYLGQDTLDQVKAAATPRRRAHWIGAGAFQIWCPVTEEMHP